MFRDINSEVKNKSLHLGTPTTKKEAQQLVCISELWRHHAPSLDLLPQPVSQVAQKVASFLLGAKNRWTSVKGPGCCAGCSASFMVRKEFVWSLSQCLIVNHRFWILVDQHSVIIASIKLFFLFKTGLGLIFYVSGNWANWIRGMLLILKKAHTGADQMQLKAGSLFY